MGRIPELTICVCTHNRPGYLAGCLKALRQQTAPPELFEILVVDSASSAEPATVAAQLAAAAPNARLLRVEEPGLSIARNAGAGAAHAEYICYLDDDALAEPDLVATALLALPSTHPAPALIGGRALPLWEAPLPTWWPASLRGVLSIVETGRMRRIPQRRVAARAGTLRRDFPCACSHAAGCRRL